MLAFALRRTAGLAVTLFAYVFINVAMVTGLWGTLLRSMQEMIANYELVV